MHCKLVFLFKNLAMEANVLEWNIHSKEAGWLWFEYCFSLSLSWKLTVVLHKVWGRALRFESRLFYRLITKKQLITICHIKKGGLTLRMISTLAQVQTLKREESDLRLVVHLLYSQCQWSRLISQEKFFRGAKT
jgi:hypothetical protein